MLCSFLINHLQGSASTDHGVILFYMFNALDNDKRTPLSAVCSLIYQLLSEPAVVDEPLFRDIYRYKATKSGQEKADDFAFLWSAFAKHSQALSTLTIVVDALDECENREAMLSAITKLLKSSKIKVIISSRREPDITRVLESFLQIRFGSKENNVDISSFLTSQISRNSILNSAAVDKRLHKGYDVGLSELLLARSNGCFLWATSALKELGRKATITEIMTAVKGLPSDLIDLYRSILTGYSDHFSAAERKVCSLVLRWLVCAARPLAGVELWAAVRNEYLYPSLEDGTNGSFEGDMEDDWDDDASNNSDHFLFSRGKIEEICGSLVTVDHGLVRLAHLSIAEFLCQRPLDVAAETQKRNFYVDPEHDHLCLAVGCIKYISRSLGVPPIQPEDRGHGSYTKDVDEDAPFLKYSIYYWPFHLTQSSAQSTDLAITPFEAFLFGSKMLYWLEMWLAIGDQNLWDLERQLEAILQWSDQCEHPVSGVVALIYRWSKSMSRLLDRYGTSLEARPSEIHFIDPHSYDDFEEAISISSKFTPPNSPVHIPHFRLLPEDFPKSSKFGREPDPCRALHLPPHDLHRLAIFHVDERRNVIYLASSSTSVPELRCQDVKTGRQLRPVRLACEEQGKRHFSCVGFAISQDGDALAVLYESSGMDGPTMMTFRYDLIVWKLTKSTLFGEPESKPWCMIVKSESYHKAFPGFSSRSLVIDASNKIYCPWGIVDINKTDLGFTSSEASNEGSATACLRSFFASEQAANLRQLTFSSDCRSIIAYDHERSSIVKYDTDTLSMFAVMCYAPTGCTICCVSYSGWYVVLRDSDDFGNNCYLLDWVKKRCVRIPGSESIRSPTDFNLKFTNSEEYLVGTMADSTNAMRQYVSVWSSLSGDIQQTASQPIPVILGFHLSDLTQSAYIATNRGWTDFNLLCLEHLPDFFKLQNHERSFTYSTVSRKGGELALLCIQQQR